MTQRDESVRDVRNEVMPFKYEITSYGTDFDVEGLVRRINREDIYVPPFQRRFVWSQRQASRFVESLLLGLPVPGVFLSRDVKSRFLVIDGQQRLRSLQYFYKGIFEPTGKVFALTGLQTRFNTMTYERLLPEDQRRLNDAIIHATIIRQDQPEDANSSIYFVFERLNTGGTLLRPQEIRSALYHGPFNDLLGELNTNEDWRSLFGRTHSRRRDQELILRFLALYFRSTNPYRKPMKEFLNVHMGRNRFLQLHSSDEITGIFEPTVNIINNSIGFRAFKPKRALNAAICDSVMVGVAENLRDGWLEPERLAEQHSALLSDEEYQLVIETATTDEDSVDSRIHYAIMAFMGD